MRRKLSIIIIAMALISFIGAGALHANPNKAERPDLTVSHMTITGSIARGNNGYVIRGKVPAEIFTILNPDTDILNELVESGQAVILEVRIVSGDNIEIKMIDGKKYHPTSPK